MNKKEALRQYKIRQLKKEVNPTSGQSGINHMQDPNLKPDELKAAEQAASEVETEETTDNAEEGGLEG